MKKIKHSHVLDFIRAGKATITVESKKTGVYFTYQFDTPREENAHTAVRSYNKWPIWVKVLNGADNTSNYVFLGTIFGHTYRHSQKSRVSANATAVVALKWWLDALVNDRQSRLQQLEVYHAGRCMRCGRKLTTPASIELGVGPVCGDELQRQKLLRDKKIRHFLEQSGIDPTAVDAATKAELIGFFKGTDNLWK